MQPNQEQPQQSNSQAPGVGRGRGRGGSKKGQSGNPSRRPKPPAEAALPEEPGWEGAGDLLREVRWAFRNYGRRCVGTGAQEELRKLFKDNPEKFLDLKVKLEQQFTATRPPSPGPERLSTWTATPPPDEGTARCLELAEQVIQNILAKRAAGKKA